MATNQLTASTSSSSSQASTQSPQGSTDSGFGASQSSGGVQPGTAPSLLTGQSGVQLSNTALSTINLNAPSTTASASSSAPTVIKHHINLPLLGLSGLLIVIAVVLFMTAGRSVKSTT